MQMSQFESIPPMEMDMLAANAARYASDPRENKVMLGIGAYRTEAGPHVFRAVVEAEKRVVGGHHEYAPFGGGRPIAIASQKIAFGTEIFESHGDRIASVQAISGTGALNIALQIYRDLNEKKVSNTIHLSDPSWSNHAAISKNLGFEVKYFPFFEPESRSICFDKMTEYLKNIPDYSLVLLQSSCHNPTGCELSPEQWIICADICKEKNFFVIVDTAYQGFCTGDLLKDGLIHSLLVERDIEFLLCQSFAKIMGLYGERTGMVHAFCKSVDVAKRMQQHLTGLTRKVFSSAPIHGSKILVELYNDPVLREDWLLELNEIVFTMRKMRELFRAKLEELGAPGTWNHITDNAGLFSMTGLTKEQTKRLAEEKAVYLCPDGRIAVCTKYRSDFDIFCLMNVLRPLLLVAHPDDEAMFFTPSLIALKPFIWCASKGLEKNLTKISSPLSNSNEKHTLRTHEVIKSATSMQLPIIIDTFKDGENWDPKLLAKFSIDAWKSMYLLSSINHKNVVSNSDYKHYNIVRKYNESKFRLNCLSKLSSITSFSYSDNLKRIQYLDIYRSFRELSVPFVSDNSFIYASKNLILRVKEIYYNIHFVFSEIKKLIKLHLKNKRVHDQIKPKYYENIGYIGYPIQIRRHSRVLWTNILTPHRNYRWSLITKSRTMPKLSFHMSSFDSNNNITYLYPSLDNFKKVVIQERSSSLQNKPILPIITFDKHGVSKHKNHIQLWQASNDSKLKSRLSKLNIQTQLFELQSRPKISKKSRILITRPISYYKYNINGIFKNTIAKLVEIWHNIPFIIPEESICITLSRLEGRELTSILMNAHKSQLVWFRRLYIVVSQFTHMNCFTKRIN